MRQDRPFDAIRPLTFETGYIAHHKGSVLVTAGETRVIVAATVEDRVPPHCLEKGIGWVTAEYAMLPAATHTRKQREAERGKRDGRSTEIQRLIGRALRNVVELKPLGRRTIHIDCDVLQADGGTRCASITGAWVALHLCLSDLVARKPRDLPAKKVEDILKGQVAAISVGVLKDQVLVDLCYDEDSKADTDLNLVARPDGSIIEVQGTAEGAPLLRSQLNAMLDQGTAAIEQIGALQLAAVEAALSRGT